MWQGVPFPAIYACANQVLRTDIEYLSCDITHSRGKMEILILMFEKRFVRKAQTYA